MWNTKLITEFGTLFSGPSFGQTVNAHDTLGYEINFCILFLFHGPFEPTYMLLQSHFCSISFWDG